jgi:hypothetical protein
MVWCVVNKCELAKCKKETMMPHTKYVTIGMKSGKLV